MADVDVSSYPKPVAPKSMFEQVKDLGAIQQQRQQIASGALTIEKQKLDLLANRMEEFSKGLLTLSQDPTLDFNKIDNYAKNQVKIGYLTPEIYANAISTLPQNASPQEYQNRVKQFAMQASQTHEAVKQMYGNNENVDQGNQTALGVRQSPMMGGGFKQTGTLYQQPSPGQPVNVNGQQSVVGPAGPPGVQPPPQGVLRFAQPQPQQRVSGPIGPTIERTDLEQPPQQQSNQRFPNAIPTAAAPLFDEGKKFYTQDQELATQKLTAIKPALLAVNLIPDLRSGPGTATWNQAVAALKANNIIPTQIKDDPTAIYQEVNKYLHQYLKGRGGRSDADLQAAEDSSPNPGKQINPALLKLTQTAIAQDRIEAARALNFGARNDYQNYGRYRSSFPAMMDERAFSVDTMTPEQKKDLAKEIKKMTPNQLERFKNSLKVFDTSKVGG